jgi:hypothetical protein
MKAKIATTVLLAILSIVIWMLGYRTGQTDEQAFIDKSVETNCLKLIKVTKDNTDHAVEAEYVRVLSAVARTMRCSTEAEHKAGNNHECDPSEIEQDAGLTDEKGTKIY